MIKLKLAEVRVLVEPLKKLSSQELPVKKAWQIVNLCEVVENHVNKIEKFRVDLIQKYGDTFDVYTNNLTSEEIYVDDNTETVNLDEYTLVAKRKEIRNKDKLNQFYNEFNELLSIEEDIIEDKIDLSDISDSIRASVQELFVLKNVFIF